MDEEVYAALQERGVAFVDTPNSVLRRLLGLANAAEDDEEREADNVPKKTRAAGRKTAPKKRGGRKRKRAPTGTILREDEYEIPLLRVLEARGGSGPAGQVIDALGEELNSKLLDNDHERLASGRIRWQNRAQFVRLRLVEAGDLKDDSPRGVWEISEQGRERLAEEAGT